MHSGVAIVYDGSIRDSGTPRLFREAFAEVLGREVPWYTQAAAIPEGHSFYFHIDDGRDDITAVPPGPWGYFATDTHLGPIPRLEKARQADITWCAQPDAAKLYREQGINAHWLPLACSPFHHPTAVEVAEQEGTELAAKEYDVAFVGHLQTPDQSSRIAFLDAFVKDIPSFRFEFGVFGREMAKRYHKARIGINHAVRNDLNMRTFELASAGVPQLCDQRMMGLKDIGFEPWVHYIPYGGPWSHEQVAEDAVQTALFALKTPGGLPAMARRAHDLVRAQHKYTDRVEVMLRDASKFVGFDLCKSNADASPVCPSTTPTTTTRTSVLSAVTQ